MVRRRSPRVIWLPQDPTLSVGGTSVYQQNQVITSGPPGSFGVIEFPLVIDQVKDPTLATTSLADIGSSGYRLRRVVGKIWARVNSIAESTPVSIVVTAGIIVRRTGETPNSLAFLTGNASTLSPGEIQNTEDPWVWRRSWYLGNPLAVDAPATGTAWPGQNFSGQYGSTFDGPHVDQKTARLVGPEERLFLNVSSTVIIPEANPQVGGELRTFILTDLRVLGSLRTSSGNRRNASR